MSISLYEIDAEYKGALAELEAMDDIDQDCIDASLSVLKGSLDAKCLAVAAFIKNIDAEANAIKEAKAALAARQSAAENKSKRLREYLAAHLPSKLSDAQTTISPVKGRKSIKVVDESLLPDSCFKITRSVVAASVKSNFDELPEGAAVEVIGNPTVMIK